QQSGAPSYPGFFFSSRRRHTRWPRDWSSDVCSSDLSNRHAGLEQSYLAEPDRHVGQARVALTWIRIRYELDQTVKTGVERRRIRSEERRVGKEWGARGWGVEGVVDSEGR